MIVLTVPALNVAPVYCLNDHPSVVSKAMAELQERVGSHVIQVHTRPASSTPAGARSDRRPAAESSTAAPAGIRAAGHTPSPAS